MKKNSIVKPDPKKAKVTTSTKTLRKPSKFAIEGNEEKATPAPVPMPSHEEIQKLYQVALDAMAIPEHHRPKLWEQSDEKKWEIIQAQNVYVTQNEGNSRSTATFWVEKMKQRNGQGKPIISLGDARELQTALRTGHRSFLLEFVENDGLTELNYLANWFADHSDKTPDEVEIVRQIVSSYKVLLNNNIGMEAALATTGTITSITMCLDYYEGADTDMTISQEVVDLLSVTCWYSKEGRKLVMEGIQDVRVRRRENLRFQHLVYFLEHTKSLAFKVSIATFITNVCNCFGTLEERVRVRNDFLALDIIKVYERILPKAKSAVDEYEAAQWEQVKNQYQVFVGILKRDQSELVYKMLSAKDEDSGYTEIDMSNIDDVWNLIQKNANHSGCQDKLLSMSHALLFVPTENTLAVPVFDAITRYIREATSFEQTSADGKKVPRQDFTTPPPLDYSSLTKLFEEKLALDAKMSQLTTSDEIIKKQSEKINSLQALVMKLKREPGVAAKVAAGGEAPITMEPEEDIQIMKEREKKLLYEISELKKQLQASHRGKPTEDTTNEVEERKVASELLKSYTGKLDSTGLIPAGIAPGAQKVDPPPCPIAGMPGSLENAPVQSSKGKGSTSTESKEAADQKKAIEAIKKLGLPEKAPVVPGVKMTHIFWTPVAPDKLEGTIWPELSDQNVKFDKKELESLFGKLPGLPTKKSTGTLRNNTSVTLLDGTRKQNLGIAIKKLRIKPKALKNAVLSMEETILTSDTTLVLLESVPHEDEIDILNKYVNDGNDVEKLDKEEKFLWEMSSIPRLKERLMAIRTLYGFDESTTKIVDVIKSVRAAIAEVEQSSKLKRMLEIILAVGNYANGGTPRGSAWGFKLDLLSKLDAIKDNDNNSFMMFLYRLCERNYPDLCSFALPAVRTASEISLTDFMADLNLLATNVQKVKTEIEQESVAKNDKFAKVMSKFEVKASADVARLQGEFEKVRADFHNLAQRFAESGPKTEPNTFFSKLVEFEDAFERAKRAIMKQKRDAELNQKVEEEKQRRMTLRKLRRLQEQTDDPNLFEAFRKAQTGTSAEVADRFIERWKKEQMKKSQKEIQTKAL